MIEAFRVVIDGYLLELSASALVGMACGLIGCFVILRGMAMVGDAISHSVLPGVVIAYMLAGTGPLAMFLGAMSAGIVTSISINVIQHNSRIKGDSAIGLVFTFFFAIGIILIGLLPRGTHFDLKCFLFGNPLAVGKDDLWMMVIIALVVSLNVIAFFRPLRLASFDPVTAASIGIKPMIAHYLIMVLLAATVVASLQAVGIIMVVAMIIAPGATAYQWVDDLGRMLVLAAVIGLVSAGLGFVVGFWQNWDTGSAMTVVAGGLFVLSIFFSPRYGVLASRIQRRRNISHIQREDILKSLIHVPEHCANAAVIAKSARINPKDIKRLTHKLVSGNLIVTQDNGKSFSLTHDGEIIAEHMLRSHRLWEVLLAQAGYDKAQIHLLAERLEHAHEVSDQFDTLLGNPDHDPHGQKIPRALQGEEI